MSVENALCDRCERHSVAVLLAVDVEVGQRRMLCLTCLTYMWLVPRDMRWPTMTSDEDC